MNEDIDVFAHRKVGTVIDAKIMTVNGSTRFGAQGGISLRGFFKAEREWQLHVLRVAFYGEGSDQDIPVPLFFNPRTVEGDVGKLIALKEVRRLQVRVTLFDAGVDAGYQSPHQSADDPGA